MRIRVQLFGVLKDLLPMESNTLEVPDGATVAAVLDELRSRSGKQSGIWRALATAVNQQYAPADTALKDGDEVALLPPVSGGLDGQPEEIEVVLTHESIDGNALAELLKRPEDGAVVIFDGIVRNNTRGRRTLFLHYEAYEDMALREMQRLAAEAQMRFGVRGITVVHRLGKLDVGETSVWIGVASAHRGQAFDACRWIIDTLKKQVPIWKKEHFEDGAMWADGEPFSEGLTATGEA